jgi:hypothetical protein
MTLWDCHTDYIVAQNKQLVWLRCCHEGHRRGIAAGVEEAVEANGLRQTLQFQLICYTKDGGGNVGNNPCLARSA